MKTRHIALAMVLILGEDRAAHADQAGSAAEKTGAAIRPGETFRTALTAPRW